MQALVFLWPGSAMAAPDRPSRSITMSQTAFCYHCGIHHPLGDMRQIPTKAGPRWRCVKSIEASQKGAAAREAFGRQTTAINKADMEAAKRRMTNPERKPEK